MKRLVLAVAALGCLGAAPAARAADQTLAAPLCEILKQLLPEVRGYKPEGARAQLVMAVAERFDYNAARLRQVRTDVDAVTTTACAKDREAMLGILKMKSLSEALG